MDKTYGEKAYNVTYGMESTDIVTDIKIGTAKLADLWANLLEEYVEKAEGDGESALTDLVKVDYLIRALERLEEASFLAVKSQFI